MYPGTRPETIYQNQYIWWMKWKPKFHLKKPYIIKGKIGWFINIPFIGYILLSP